MTPSTWMMSSLRDLPSCFYIYIYIYMCVCVCVCVSVHPPRLCAGDDDGRRLRLLALLLGADGAAAEAHHRLPALHQEQTDPAHPPEPELRPAGHDAGPRRRRPPVPPAPLPQRHGRAQSQDRRQARASTEVSEYRRFLRHHGQTHVTLNSEVSCCPCAHCWRSCDSHVT